MERHKANHRGDNLFYETVVLLPNIVEVLDLPDRAKAPRPFKFQDHVHGYQAGQVCTTFVDRLPDQIRHLRQ
jgi:hypothetical protein